MNPLLIPVLIVSLPLADRPNWPKVDFRSRFGRFDGCFVIEDLRGGSALRFNEGRCKRRFSPCSTFKIFNALAGLDAGVLKDENTTFKWDGSHQPIRAWEHDHTLATAIRDSVVWYFRRVAKGVGLERMQSLLDRADYGNHSTAGNVTSFWLDDSLQISADEQVCFLRRLYTNRLPFTPRSMALVRKLIVLKQGRDWTFSGKTGSGGHDGRGALGWFVGHVRSGKREFVFAVNISAADKANGPAAREIALAILRDLKLIN